ncbi:hypothetical protein [Palleronia sp. LCG004]|uniref:hypothetical protein n=1 Tax=Palleronia sp. LCG004 TaxID=3079304 RepID=UPI002941DD29|nr:hypothetical protein [Palleronia sp. LCG004]WOI56182.1 hypothetical protein RVY76_14310 [Palleronia sp. LCG004]
MIIRVAICLGVLTIAGSAEAQSVLVRTGEHDGFTRVVLNAPQGMDWSIDREGGTVRISGPGTARYDLANVYRPIARARVGTIEAAGEGDLLVELNCACQIDSFETGSGAFVLDIVDPVEGAPVEVDMAALFPDDPLRLPDPPVILPGPLSRALDPSLEARAEQDILAQARRTMTEQLARGAAQNLVTVSEPVELPDMEEDVIVAEEEVRLPVTFLPDGLYPNMRVETQVDRDGSGGPRPITDTACLPAAKFDFAAWGDPVDPFGKLRALRPELFGETGRRQGEVYAEMAKSYLYLTFGAEARALLADSPENTPDREILTEIARNMDNGLGSPALASQLNCDSNAAILAFLDRESPRPDDPSVLIRRYLDLPTTLRTYVGPRLAERFLDMGLTEDARTIRNAYRREPAVTGAEDAFVAARIEGGSSGEGETELATVVEERLPRAAEAMTFLLTAMTDRGERVPAETADQALALSFETADPARAELERAVLRAIAARPAIVEAFGEIDRLKRISRGPFDEIEHDLFARILATESDAEFLRLMVPFAERPIADPELRLAIAERLRAESLWKQAETVIDASESIPTREERIVRAEIAVDAGKDDVARSYLAGLDGPDAEAVLVRLTEEEDPVVEMAEGDTPPAPDVPVRPIRSNPELSQAEDLLTQTSQLRDELNAILAQ